MSPLARVVYRVLVRHLRAGHGSITYGALAAGAAATVPTHHRSAVFHAALAEISRACRAQRLPCLPAIAWRASPRRPGPAYFPAAHPAARTDEARRRAWEREHAAVIAAAARYPRALDG